MAISMMNTFMIGMISRSKNFMGVAGVDLGTFLFSTNIEMEIITILIQIIKQSEWATANLLNQRTSNNSMIESSHNVNQKTDQYW